MSEATILELFPVNGLDRSLHAPVFVGLFFITLFAETLGWTFAGLVVPGYLASVILAAPATAVLVGVETVLTYVVCALIGKWLPRTQAWSTAFGRERFFLFILVALAVRLAIEANLLPWLAENYELPHSRELHSLGLVLVPLLANMFWNDGFVRSLLHVTVLVGLTYVVVDVVLLEHTNFTVSRFEVANESVSLSFLETPHAQFILLIGALIAARANVLYGWDYNGILVPALLSVAWYQPTKLATTIVEALVVYGLSRGAAALPPLSRVLLVGTRRTLLVFTVGFIVKWLGGFAVQRVDPTLHVIDYLGFGYLLPTLLATKMWNRNSIGTVVVPTIQVSIVAFVVGNLAGYGTTLLEGETEVVGALAEPESSTRSTATELMLADTSPDVDPSPQLAALRKRLCLDAVERLRAGETFGQALLERAMLLNVRLSITADPTGSHLVLGPKSPDPDRDRATPRAAVRLAPGATAPWMVVAVANEPSSETIAASMLAARLVDARAIVVEAEGRPLGALDRAFSEELAEVLGIQHVMRVRLGPRSELGVVGEVARAIGVPRFSTAFGSDLPLRWMSPEPTGPEVFRRASTLALTRAVAQAAGATVLGAPEVASWPNGVASDLSAHLIGLTSTRPFMFEGPSIEELRLFKRAIVPAFMELGRDREPTPWERALADQLGYRYVRIVEGGDGEPQAGGAQLAPTVAWALMEPPSPTRHGHATWIRRTSTVEDEDPGVMVEAPASRWETGTYRASLVLFDGLPAESLLVAGAPPNADAEGRSDVRRISGRRSYYHIVHQAWVDAGRRAVVAHGIAEARDPGRELVVSTGQELSGIDDLSPWSGDVARFFDGMGFDVAVFNGSLTLSAFDGGYDPALGYARRFAPDSTLLLWLSPGLRRQLVRIQEDDRTARRLDMLGIPVVPAAVAARAAERSRCPRIGEPAAVGGHDSCVRVRWTPGPRCPAVPEECACDPEALVRALEAYTLRRNPHILRAALVAREPCRVDVLHDRRSGLLWALMGAGDQTWLVPLMGGPARRQDEPIVDERALQRLVITGLSSTRVVL
ncbi:MAG: poly-gamma-glutamate biosynthesis protein PgsC/CapC [Myxococcales bacterium]|nr:poly-gamma-glutamate biosynthesis protein PgsC/CapC [Myxococcales bacterium]